MSLFCVSFFHDYGITNTCLTKQCQDIHLADPSFDRTRDLSLKILACLPILGQIIGVVIMAFGVLSLRSPCRQQKTIGASLFLRGLLTVLGLGILCLLLDLIVTLVTVIKNKIS